MKRPTFAAVSLALVVALGGAACDREDAADVREGINEVEEGAEKVGNEVEKGVDEFDSDGKDD